MISLRYKEKLSFQKDITILIKYNKNVIKHNKDRKIRKIKKCLFDVKL